MNENKFPKKEIVILALGEVLVGALVTLVFLLVKKFDYTVPLGALLGGAVTVLNFVFLSVTVNKALDEAMKCLEARNADKALSSPEETADSEDESDPYNDEAAKFARENSARISNAVKTSYIVRTVSVLATLALAFITKQFNVLATVIPILCFRPILTISELIKAKGGAV